jgi:hypothetical protein
MHFRIQGLDPAPFAPLFAMPGEELSQRHIVRVVADAKPGFPCRVSLEDAQPGKPLLLLNYEHLPVDSPYRASHAIYVAADAKRFDAVDTLPAALRDRLLSLRAFDEAGMMIDADIAQGLEVEPLIERLLASPRTRYVHAHFARRGCFAARIEHA